MSSWPRRQHMRNCTMMGDQLFQDILSYSLPLIGCPESSSDEDIHVATGVSTTLVPRLFGSSLRCSSFRFCRLLQKST